ncbi:hypothetical protein EVAR_82329_1 [Eumeta japonica]|uniref:Uncharacterized protein n=1 Tax=Eumeta variegata TaxID=151549 RepID=A0A4C1UB66_EUMVA|nr:hypothetical protein EVAR_82329_1 [Eumeta japonica]
MEMVASSSTEKPFASYALLKIVSVRVTGTKGHVDTHALLNDGFTVTLVDAVLATRIEGEESVDPPCIEAIVGTKLDAAASRRDNWHLLVFNRIRRWSRTQPACVSSANSKKQSPSPSVCSGKRQSRAISSDEGSEQSDITVKGSDEEEQEEQSFKVFKRKHKRVALRLRKISDESSDSTIDIKPS